LTVWRRLFALGGLWAVLAAPPGACAAQAGARYVGSARCANCHPGQSAPWLRSHHAQAMQPASAATVLGDFDGAVVGHDGQVTRFFRRGGRFFVRTAGADGQDKDFPVAYTLGVHPLQQVLIAQPGGRLQVLGLAWDARPLAEGGQRWYPLYPDSPPRPGEPLHWTGRDQNWNFMCASCHTTGLRRNYELAGDRYDSRWSEPGVGCEACHGAGSAHLAWAGGSRKQRLPGLGLAARALAARGQRFGFSQAGQKIAAPQGGPAPGQAANESCLACHSRRQQLVPDAAQDPGAAYLDRYAPSLIEPGLYHADGQIDGEVFEGGSYAQSAMHRAGVACGACHDPHSLKLRAPGNALCAQCHRPASYDRSEHHHHAGGSAGAQCVGCHMPKRTYMGVHERRDHSLRIPRPELSLRLGTSDACSACHADKPIGWAVAAVAAWRDGPGVEGTGASWASAVEAAWRGNLPAAEWRDALSAAPSDFAKASLLALMPADETAPQLEALAAASRSEAGLVRLGAARALAALSSPAALQLGLRLLDDPLRAVRIEAARALAGVPPARLTPAQRQRWLAAGRELVQAELASAERPETHLNIASFQLAQRQPGAAEAELRTALRLDPGFVPALVNLADLVRQQGRDDEAGPLLRRAVALAPSAAAPAHALGLWLVRAGRPEQALHCLRKALALAPQDRRYAQVLALAEAELGASGTFSSAALSVPACD
jgi:predicted CXXCH cytochrome family protein